MFRFAVTVIVDLIHWTCFYNIQQMGMKDTSLIEKINPTFIALTTTAIRCCPSARKTGMIRVLPEFGQQDRVPRQFNTRNINDAVNQAYTALFCHLNMDFRSSSQEFQAKMIDITHSKIRRRIHSTGMDPAIAQPHNHQSSLDEDFLDYVL